MSKRAKRSRQFDIYAELCPASSMTIIGAGLISVTMGSLMPGMTCVMLGICVGVGGTVTKTLLNRKIRIIK